MTLNDKNICNVGKRIFIWKRIEIFFFNLALIWESNINEEAKAGGIVHLISYKMHFAS